MSNEILIEIYSEEDFRDWLKENHDKKKKVGLILHRRHTGKDSPSHYDLMQEAICFGWIDTTLKRFDEDKFIRYFCKRNKNSSWSYNTLSYGKRLIKEGKMQPSGLKFYKEGLKKKPLDFGIPKNPNMPEELKKELEKKKNKKAKDAFDRLTPSVKKYYFRFILRAKLPETKKRRVNSILKKIGEKKNHFTKDI